MKVKISKKEEKEVYLELIQIGGIVRLCEVYYNGDSCDILTISDKGVYLMHSYNGNLPRDENHVNLVNREE